MNSYGVLDGQADPSSLIASPLIGGSHPLIYVGLAVGALGIGCIVLYLLSSRLYKLRGHLTRDERAVIFKKSGGEVG